MCTPENIISGIIVASTAIIVAGAMTTLTLMVIDDYKEKRKSENRR